jgi:hypothetical protein
MTGPFTSTLGLSAKSARRFRQSLRLLAISAMGLLSLCFAPGAMAATAPGAPTAVIAIGGHSQATVTFTAPASDGGAAITTYTATSSPDSLTGTCAGPAACTITVPTLTNGTSYTFTVTATNSVGTGTASSASAATVAGNWARHYGLSGSLTSAGAMTVDAAGNTYIAGFFTGATLAVGAGVTLTKIGIQDAFVAKLNADGTVAWAKNFGGSGATAQFASIDVDNSGNVYLGGYFSGATLTTPALTMIGNTDAFALKLDSSGNTTWAKNYGGSGAQAYVKGIAADSSGNVYLGGVFSLANMTTPAITRFGTADAFALKLSSAGATTWFKHYGGAGAATAIRNVTVDGSGNVYLGGDFSTANLTTPALTRFSTTTSSDAFALKLNSNGGTLWPKNYGGSGANTFGNSIATTR